MAQGRFCMCARKGRVRIRVRVVCPLGRRENRGYGQGRGEVGGKERGGMLGWGRVG